MRLGRIDVLFRQYAVRIFHPCKRAAARGGSDLYVVFGIGRIAEVGEICTASPRGTRT